MNKVFSQSPSLVREQGTVPVYFWVANFSSLLACGVFKQTHYILLWEPDTSLSWSQSYLPQLLVVHSAPECNTRMPQACGVLLPRLWVHGATKLLTISSVRWVFSVVRLTIPVTLVWESLVHQWGQEEEIKTIHTSKFLYNVTKFFLVFSLPVISTFTPQKPLDETSKLLTRH